MLRAVELERFAVPDGTAGRSSMQKGRKLDTPCLVTRRNGYIPTAVLAGTSIFTRNLAGSFVLLASAGKVIFADKSVTRAIGSFRLVPVNVTSTALPGPAPNGCDKLIVGACGLGGRTNGGGWAGAGDANATIMSWTHNAHKLK